MRSLFDGFPGVHGAFFVPSRLKGCIRLRSHKSTVPVAGCLASLYCRKPADVSAICFLCYWVVEKLLNGSRCTVTGCKVCEGSDFVDACSGCKLEGCLLTCESCLDRYGNVGQPAPFTVPADGCFVEESQTQLRCRPFSLGSCGEHLASLLESGLSLM